MKNLLQLILKTHQYYVSGKELLNDMNYIEGATKSRLEAAKEPSRTDILNFLLKNICRGSRYLEIGMRNPNHNYYHIMANEKYSVDPGLEFAENPADFKMESDRFFDLLSRDEILSSEIKFDVIFIDGLHLAEQVDKDIMNALKYIKNDGFIVLHDCNPPTEWHARENYHYAYTPAGSSWNGTTWKAFLHWRLSPSLNSCCIDSDWGIGLLSKEHPIGMPLDRVDKFFEFNNFLENKKHYLNLMEFEKFKRIFEN